MIVYQTKNKVMENWKINEPPNDKPNEYLNTEYTI